MQKNVEGIIEREHESLIYAVNQNPNVFVNPANTFIVDEQGAFKLKKEENQSVMISQFWENRRKKLAILLLLSAGIQFSIIANETDLINLIFLEIVKLGFSLFNMFMGLIF